uniref:Na(+)/H(+) exchange regulatory cofactor NHE-RF1 n=1 Tax=Cebus imitator TaxID=2715852 RepID=A0A2K5S7Z7_CEBIM
MSADAAAGAPLLRLCCLEKGGFHLHGEKGKPGSAAEKAGLLTHPRVVNASVDPETDEQLQKLGVQVRGELLRTQEAPGQGEPPAAAEAQGAGSENEPSEGDTSRPEQLKLRPRLCTVRKGPNGYSFSLHSDKSKPGQFIWSVDPHSPAEASGLRAQDGIVVVNWVRMEGKQHGDVGSAIRAGGDETKLLVVDRETDEFFKKCKATPSQEHLNGPLPEPFTNGEIQKNSREALAEAATESPRPALVTSTSSSDPILDFNISLAMAKERAHWKHSSKRAPQIDWSKKNELFSNL